MKEKKPGLLQKLCDPFCVYFLLISRQLSLSLRDILLQIFIFASRLLKLTIGESENNNVKDRKVDKDSMQSGWHKAKPNNC